MKYLLIEIVALIIWTIALVKDSLWYEEYKKKQERKKKLAELAKKKNLIELKWPDNTPRHDL